MGETGASRLQAVNSGDTWQALENELFYCLYFILCGPDKATSKIQLYSSSSIDIDAINSAINAANEDLVLIHTQTRAPPLVGRYIAPRRLQEIHYASAPQRPPIPHTHCPIKARGHDFIVVQLETCHRILVP